MAKAIALFSGGLDSTLAILAVLRQGIEVKAIKFQTPFDPDLSEQGLSSKDSFPVAEKFGFDIEIYRLGDTFLDMVKNPKHGYGKNMNPCIDCRILMLKKAGSFMHAICADFLVTGEVLGQRPMSQRKDTLYHIDKEAGFTGQVVRPLSARLLKISLPEVKGTIDREKLYGFGGRSRKPQIALAEEFGLIDFSLPAGGCLLTEPNYAHRMKDVLTCNPEPTLKDIELLRIGRHFRFSPLCKIIVGRDKTENEKIESLSYNDCLLKVDGFGSPLALVSGEITDEALKVAASLCARYSDAKNIPEIEVTVIRGINKFRLLVSPAGNELIEALRIEKVRTKKTAKV
jgi:hypothetical protein